MKFLFKFNMVWINGRLLSYYNSPKAKKLGAKNFSLRRPIFLKKIPFVSKLEGIVP